MRSYATFMPGVMLTTTTDLVSVGKTQIKPQKTKLLKTNLFICQAPMEVKQLPFTNPQIGGVEIKNGLFLLQENSLDDKFKLTMDSTNFAGATVFQNNLPIGMIQKNGDFLSMRELNKLISRQLGGVDEDIFDTVKYIIVEQLYVDSEEITLESNFVDDLGADSLDLVEMVMALEEAFDIEIPDEAAEGIATVGDAVNFINSNIILPEIDSSLPFDPSSTLMVESESEYELLSPEEIDFFKNQKKIVLDYLSEIKNYLKKKIKNKYQLVFVGNKETIDKDLTICRGLTEENRESFIKLKKKTKIFDESPLEIQKKINYISNLTKNENLFINSKDNGGICKDGTTLYLGNHILGLLPLSIKKSLLDNKFCTEKLFNIPICDGGDDDDDDPDDDFGDDDDDDDDDEEPR